MPMRRDPLMAVCELLPRVERFARDASDTATFTVGRLALLPDVANVIPGEVVFSADFRDADRGTMDAIDRFLLAELEKLASRGLTVEVVRNADHAPTPLDPNLIRLLDESARETGVRPLHMNSGAGHDAQVVAPHIPAGMIFIPSKNGVSHSPLEYTAPEDLGRGLAVLECALRKLAVEG